MLAYIKKKLFLSRQKYKLRGGSFSHAPLYPSASVIRTPPINIVDKDVPLFEHEYNKELILARVYTLSKALITAEGIVYCNNTLIAESAQGEIREDFYQHVLWARVTKQAQAPQYLILFNKWSMAYYHWVAEVVPKLIWFKANNDITQYTVLLPSSHNATFIQEYLNNLGYNKIEYFNVSENVVVGKAVYITELSQTGNIRPIVAQDIRQHYVSNIQAERKIYISRANAPKRKVVNEEQLTAMLKTIGFEIVYTDDMPVQQQIDMFANCSTLLSIHGAGLTNMVYMPQGSTVVELRLKGDNWNNCFFSLASALKLYYYYSLSQSADETKNTQDTDFVVDVDNIKTILKEISASTTT